MDDRALCGVVSLWEEWQAVFNLSVVTKGNALGLAFFLAGYAQLAGLSW
jgi:hypothetical protein